MKILVLSGGGTKGAFQAGVLRELLEEEPQLDYDGFVGISVGALNSAFLATGNLPQTLPELERIWLEDIKGNNSVWTHLLWYRMLIGICIIIFFTLIAFISFVLTAPKLLTLFLGLLTVTSFYIPYYFLMHVEAVYDTAPLRKLVDDHLQVDLLKKSGKLLRVGTVCVETGQYQTATEKDDDIKDWVMASAAFPVFFPRVKINNLTWTDGGVINISPLQDALGLQPTEIDVILASPIQTEEDDQVGSLPSQLMRVLDIMSSEILKNDLYAKCSKRGDIKIRVFMPEKSFGVSSLTFDPIKIRAMYETGREMVRDKKYFTYND